jgi:hypothetical protein
MTSGPKGNAVAVVPPYTPGKPLSVLDAFFSVYIGCDIGEMGPGETRVVASPRRERAELRYTEPFALWMIVAQSRCAVSVRGELMRRVTRIVRPLGIERMRDPQATQRLVIAATKTLGIRRKMSATSGPIQYCTTKTLRMWEKHACRQVTSLDVPVIEQTGLYGPSLDRSVDEGTCCAAWSGDHPVSLAGTYPVPHMQDAVADMNVPGTIESYRNQGFGRTVVSHATRAVLDLGLVPVYMTADSNVQSKRTARAVGYRTYGWQFQVIIQDKD